MQTQTGHINAKEIGATATGPGRPVVLSAAGLDPCGGAGLFADIKTFEQMKVYGLAVNTGNTIQTDRRCTGVHWTERDVLMQSVDALADRFYPAAIKIGILPSLDILEMLLSVFRQHWPGSPVIWDPVVSATAGCVFLATDHHSDPERWRRIVSGIALVTPNLGEAVWLAAALGDGPSLTAHLHAAALQAAAAATAIARYCPVLLKGGHREIKTGEDLLLAGGQSFVLSPGAYTPYQRAGNGQMDLSVAPAKHGSGCVLSAAITARLALGDDLRAACQAAKRYVENFLFSNDSLLGYHVA